MNLTFKTSVCPTFRINSTGKKKKREEKEEEEKVCPTFRISSTKREKRERGHPRPARARARVAVVVVAVFERRKRDDTRCRGSISFFSVAKARSRLGDYATRE